MFPQRKLYFEKCKSTGYVEDDFNFEVRDENESIMAVINVFESSGGKILPKIESVYIYNTFSTEAKTDWIKVDKSLMSETVLSSLANRFVDENFLHIQDLIIDWAVKSAGSV